MNLYFTVVMRAGWKISWEAKQLVSTAAARKYVDLWKLVLAFSCTMESKPLQNHIKKTWTKLLVLSFLFCWFNLGFSTNSLWFFAFCLVLHKWRLWCERYRNFSVELKLSKYSTFSILLVFVSTIVKCSVSFNRRVILIV